MKINTSINHHHETIMAINQYKDFIFLYLDQPRGTGHLAFRDIPKIIADLKTSGNVALDFGCGAGRSSKLLMSSGLDVFGIDIDLNMLTETKEMGKNRFILTGKGKIPFLDNTFDIVFNSFVLFDFSSREEMIATFLEMRRVCKNDGWIISVTNSDYLFNKKWLTVNNDFPQNKSLSSGKIAKIYLEDVSIEINDYFWLEADYQYCFKTAGLTLNHVFHPLGNHSDGYDWKDEFTFPPYAIFVCSPAKAPL